MGWLPPDRIERFKRKARDHELARYRSILAAPEISEKDRKFIGRHRMQRASWKDVMDLEIRAFVEQLLAEEVTKALLK